MNNLNLIGFLKRKFEVSVLSFNYHIDKNQTRVILLGFLCTFDFVFQRQGWLLLAYRKG